MFMAQIVMMVSWVYTHQVVYIKYEKHFNMSVIPQENRTEEKRKKPHCLSISRLTQVTPRLTCSEKHVSLHLSKAKHSICVPGPSYTPSPIPSILSFLLPQGSLQCHLNIPLLRSLCCCSSKVSMTLYILLTPDPIPNSCTSPFAVNILLLLQDLSGPPMAQS